MARLFIDANIFLRHLLQDHPEQSPRASAFVIGIDKRELEGESSASVVAEIVFTLERSYKLSKGAIRDGVGEVITLTGLALPGRALVLRALDLYAERNVSYADAYHAVTMLTRGLSTIVSFDRDFDRLPGITRVEP